MQNSSFQLKQNWFTDISEYTYLNCLSYWTLMSEDEMQLVVITTFVWPKHDGVGGFVKEFFLQHFEKKKIILKYSPVKHRIGHKLDLIRNLILKQMLDTMAEGCDDCQI